MSAQHDRYEREAILLIASLRRKLEEDRSRYDSNETVMRRAISDLRLQLAEAQARIAELEGALREANKAFEIIHDEWAGPSAMEQISAACLAASMSIDDALSAAEEKHE
jgi:uncharacterized protein involved in exopolysaccharide biosynthesis